MVKEVFSFRIEDKEALRKRIKETGLSAEELFEEALAIHEMPNSEATLLQRKQKAINERDIAINTIIERNNYIQALNRRLKNKNPSRYRNLEVEDGIVEIFDKDNNKLF